ncbi:hypothetical protein [Thalassotalea sediminis]|uniref:hypothetical protein n=1 Tax=Thalassotalea sediminis TaxID=1759089 RepID=UPI0025737D8F|nr:hypothetical protein [Thalassotalea sediminis]
MKKMDIVFIGSSELGLCALKASNRFNILNVLCLRNRLTEGLNNAAQEIGLSIKLFDWHEDFRVLINQFDIDTPFFIYQLDMLVPEDIVRKYRFFNVHRGCLRLNRGPNPDVWPILLGFEETKISLHQLNEKIDSGLYIDSFSVDIEQGEDSVVVKGKMEAFMPDIVESLYLHLLGALAGTTLSGGDYYPWIKEYDFTIDLTSDSIEVMQRKILSQRQYFGALLCFNEQKIYINDMSVSEMSIEGSLPFQRINEKIYIQKEGKEVILYVNSKAEYRPMKNRPLPINKI